MINMMKILIKLIKQRCHAKFLERHLNELGRLISPNKSGELIHSNVSPEILQDISFLLFDHIDHLYHVSFVHHIDCRTIWTIFTMLKWTKHN